MEQKLFDLLDGMEGELIALQDSLDLYELIYWEVQDKEVDEFKLFEVYRKLRVMVSVLQDRFAEEVHKLSGFFYKLWDYCNKGVEDGREETSRVDG